MKRIDIFCASQVATAICLSMTNNNTEASSSSSLYAELGRSPAIDRYNPIIQDSRRTAKPAYQPPPKPTKKNRKSFSKENIEEADQKKKLVKPSDNEEADKKKKLVKPSDVKKKGSVENAGVGRRSWSCTRPSGFISPPGSTRYLLSDNNDKGSVDVLPDVEHVVNKLVRDEPETKAKVVKTDGKFVRDEPETMAKVVRTDDEQSCDVKEKEAPSGPDQVVVLRVSLHCRGCEKKMRKHLSRMQGVTSFNIDFMAKKVTVVGDVTPLSVLASISKVKNAQLWPPTIASSIPQPGFNNPDLKNYTHGGVGVNA